jgi:hypothetical protein
MPKQSSNLTAFCERQSGEDFAIVIELQPPDLTWPFSKMAAK